MEHPIANFCPDEMVQILSFLPEPQRRQILLCNLSLSQPFKKLSDAEVHAWKIEKEPCYPIVKQCFDIAAKQMNQSSLSFLDMLMKLVVIGLRSKRVPAAPRKKLVVYLDQKIGTRESLSRR